MGYVRPAVSMTEKNKQLSRFGFSFERGGAHTSRTMMLEELGALFTYVDRPEAEKCDYLQAIDDENCLGKRGKDLESAPWYQLFDGDRINDHHLPLAEKRMVHEKHERHENE